MSEFVLHALRRKRAIAEKAGQLERVERIDARLAQLAEPERSAKDGNDTPSEIDATDAAIELAAELGTELASVEGTGDDGRVLKGDVWRAAEASTEADEA